MVLRNSLFVFAFRIRDNTVYLQDDDKGPAERETLMIQEVG